MTTQLSEITNELRDRLAAMGVHLPMELKRRDPREPGRKQKEATELAIRASFRRYFSRQKKKIRDKLKFIAPYRKAVDDLEYYTSEFGDEFWQDDEYVAELGRILVGATAEGIDIFADLMPLEIDYTLANQAAADWAWKYAGNLVGDIDTTTRGFLRMALSDFVTTPGMTIGDIVSVLPYTDSRSLMIAITETTKAFAMAERIAGNELQKAYPDIPVVKQWYTNQDDIVCDICRPLGEEDAIPLSSLFGGEHEQPPAHVNCRCWMSTSTRIGEEWD